MNYTSNYNLKLPERNEQFNIDDWNSNTMAIDSQMKTNATNIGNNATNIATIFTGLNTKNVSDTNSVYYKLMKLIYPVGSIYWSSNSANPSTLFGGTWTQIKDKFVLACGDTYPTTGATGGASTVTLTVNNLPSHSHTIGGTTGNTQPTFSGTRAESESAGSHSHTTNSQSATNTGNQSANPSYSWTGGHSHRALVFTGNERQAVNYKYAPNTDSSYVSNNWGLMGSGAPNFANITNHTTSSSYKDSVGYATVGNYGAKKSSSTANQKNIIESTSLTVSGTTTGNHTHDFSHTHGTDSQGSHKHYYTPSGTVSNHNHSLPANTGSTGSATAVDKMPPYIVKYCWERTA